jgi:hypothetical protein
MREDYIKRYLSAYNEQGLREILFGLIKSEEPMKDIGFIKNCIREYKKMYPERY